MTNDRSAPENLWTIQNLADFLNTSIQAIYDHRYRGTLNKKIFLRMGRCFRIVPWKVKELLESNELFIEK